MTRPFSHHSFTRRRYYVEDKELGIYRTPTTANKTIRMYFVYAAAVMTTTNSTFPLPDDFKDVVVYYAALKAVKRLMAQDPKKYAFLEGDKNSGLTKDYNDARNDALTMGDKLAGETTAYVRPSG